MAEVAGWLPASSSKTWEPQTSCGTNKLDTPGVSVSKPLRDEGRRSHIDFDFSHRLGHAAFLPTATYLLHVPSRRLSRSASSLPSTVRRESVLHMMFPGMWETMSASDDISGRRPE